MFDTSPLGIRALAKEGENSFVEFKTALPPSHVIENVFYRFARSNKGILLIGIGNNGEILGVSPQDEVVIQDRLSRGLTKLFPERNWSVDSVDIDSKRVVFAQVLESPYDIAESQKASSRKALYSFFVQTLSSLMIVAALWWIAGRSRSEILRNFIPTASSTDLFVLLVLVAAVLCLIFYGTSFTVLPIDIFGFFFPFRLLLRLNEHSRSGTLRNELHNGQRPSRTQEIDPDLDVHLDDNLPEESRSGVEVGRADEQYLVKPTATTGELGALVGSGLSPESPEVEELLDEIKARSSYIARKLERKTNTYLILGVLCGACGLSLWLFKFNAPDETKGWLHVAIALIPRVTILLFVELLAGFFLKQYRIGIEDFKQIFEVELKARWKSAAYVILKTHGKASLKTFALRLGEGDLISRFKHGESTSALEAMKLEENIALEAMRAIVAIKKELKSKKNEERDE